MIVWTRRITETRAQQNHFCVTQQRQQIEFKLLRSNSMMTTSKNTVKEKADTEFSQQDVEEKDTTDNINENGEPWQPKPEAILAMFEKLSEGMVLPLKWKCPGRRLLQKDVLEEETVPERMDVDEEDTVGDNQRAPEPSAFDFDESQSDVSKLSPRRTPGFNRTPRTEKRVARMDNIMDSLRKQQMQRAAERDARRLRGSPLTGGRGRLLNFGGPRQALNASSPVKTPGTTMSTKTPGCEVCSPFLGTLVTQEEPVVTMASVGIDISVTATSTNPSVPVTSVPVFTAYPTTASVTTAGSSEPSRPTEPVSGAVEFQSATVSTAGSTPTTTLSSKPVEPTPEEPPVPSAGALEPSVPFSTSPSIISYPPSATPLPTTPTTSTTETFLKTDYVIPSQPVDTIVSLSRPLVTSNQPDTSVTTTTSAVDSRQSETPSTSNQTSNTAIFQPSVTQTEAPISHSKTETPSPPPMEEPSPGENGTPSSQPSPSNSMNQTVLTSLASGQIDPPVSSCIESDMATDGQDPEDKAQQ